MEQAVPETATGVARPRARRGFLDLSDPQRFGMALVLPAQAVLLFIVVFPMLTEIYISLTTWSPTRGGNWWEAHRFWAWLANYTGLLGDPDFTSSVWRTAVIVAVAVPIEFLLGLGLALLFLDRFLGHRLLYTFMLLPMMIIPSVTGYIFFMLFQSNGPLNALLSFVTRQEVTITWLQQGGTAMLAIIAADVWQWTPLMFMILLAGMLALPEDQMKAAIVLGASPLQRFWLLMVPMLRPIMVIALIIRGMEAVKIFDAVWLMTAGGPGKATETISVFTYRIAFQNVRWSLAAAAGIMILILMSIAATFAIRFISAPHERGAAQPAEPGGAR